jgi:hypothetical protein
MDRSPFKKLIPNQPFKNLRVVYEIQSLINPDSVYKNVRLRPVPGVESI